MDDYLEELRSRVRVDLVGGSHQSKIAGQTNPRSFGWFFRRIFCENLLINFRTILCLAQVHGKVLGKRYDDHYLYTGAHLNIFSPSHHISAAEDRADD